MKQRRMDYHLHTLHSMDGRQSVDALCQSMLRLGVDEICLTEHIEPGHPQADLDVPPVWERYFADIRQAREDHPGLIIRAGVEIGDNPLLRDQIKADLDLLPLDFRLLSLHLVNQVDCYDTEEYFAGKTRAQAYREYAEAKAESILSWTDVFDEILKHVIRNGKCLEVNTSGFVTTGDTFAHSSILRRYVDLGGELFTFGSDSHDTTRNYDGIERARELVRSIGGKYQASFDQRKMTVYAI